MKIGDTLPVTVNAGKVKLTGTVSEIVPSVNPQSRSFVVKVTIPNNTNIYSGTFGQVRIPVGMTKVVAIPNADIQQSGQLKLVYVQTTQALNRVYITTGKSINKELIDVLSGLNAGDHIVSPGVVDE